MKQESIHHPQHKSYPRDPQIRAYYRSDDESEALGAGAVEGVGYGIRDWQNPSRFRREDAR